MFMKTRLTLLAVALFAVCAYAANFWKAAEDTPTAAGTVLVDDELMTAKTVFGTTLKASNATIAGEEFTHYIQVRNAANPSADNPNGTENEGSTSIELNVKKDLTLTFFYRRQSTAQEETGGVYASNDGKDLKIFNKEDFSNLDGELTIDHETEDFKYGFVKKTYQVSPGNYVVSARGTTIQFFGMTHEGVEVVPTIGPAIDITIESGKDISAELAAAMQGNPMPERIAIKLAAGGSYTFGQTINTAAPLTIVGDATDPATIDASAVSAPLFAISTTPYESTLDANNFYAIGDIAFCNIIVKGIKQQFIYGNKVKSLIGKLTLDNSVLEVAGGSKTVFDFNGGGVVGELAITNSTIYGNPQNTGGLYSSQSGQKATEAGLDMQKFTLKNSTFYNIAYGKNVNSHRQSNQTWLGYEVKNCLVVDCGKDGQFIKGLNGGQSGKNPVWDIEGNSFQRIVEGVMTDISANEETGDDDEPVKDNVEGVVVFAGDYATGDFTLGNCPQNTAKVGDPRWLSDVPEGPIYIETDVTSQFAALTNYTNWVGATGYATWAAPQVTTNDGKQVYMCEKYETTSESTGDVFYQNVTGLAPGIYKIELYGSAAFTFGRGIGSGIFSDDDTPEGPITERTGIALYAQTSKNTVSQEIAAYKVTQFAEVSTAVLEGVEVSEDGTMKLAMSKNTNYTNWHIVQLKGVTALVNAADLYASTIAQAQALLDQPMNAGVLAQLQAAMVDASTLTTAEQYKDAVENLQSKIQAAEASIAIYKSVKEALDTYAAKAATLDADGQAAYNVADIQKAYDERTLENDACIADIKAKYVAAVKAQTTPGSDFTDAASKQKDDWIGSTGTYNAVYAERFGEEMPADTIMYQTVEGLPEGTYKVELNAVASQAWNTAAVGNDITVAFANDGIYSLEVIAQVACDPEQSIATMEANVGSDGKLTMGLKNIAVGGNWFVVQVKSITLLSLKETIGPAIDITIESGKDISTELAAAMQDNPMPESITIKLAAGGSYTIGQTINTAAPLTIVGDATDPATIDASAVSAPLFAISTTPYESTLDANNFYAIGDIAFCNIIVKGIKQQFIYGNKVKSLIGKLTLDNSVLEVAGGSKTVFDFNGGGVVGELAITNSTIYGNPQNTGGLYSSQSGQKATEAGLDMQKFTLKNSTFYNIAYGKNVNSHRQSNQTWLGYEVKNCLVVDCGKDGQFIKGLNGGQSGKNPVWDIEGNSFQRIVEGVMTDISANEETGDDDEPVKDNVEGVVVFAGDYATGDLTLGNCPQNTAKVGDPRWLNDTNFYKFVATEWPAGDPGRISPDNVTVDETANTITVSQTGQNNVALIFRSSNVYTVPATDHYFIIKATGLSVNEGDSYLWWLNNTNNGGSYKPTVIYEEDGQTVFAWDVNVISIGGLLGTEDAEFKDEGGWSTTFGMTLADANVPAVISYIGFTNEIAEPLDEAEYAWDPTLWVAGDPGRISPDKVVADVDAKTITVSQTGDNNVALVYKTDKVLYVNNAKYFVILGKGLSTTDTKSYLWWLNNTNNGTQVPPTYAVENADGLVYFIWNIAESGLGASFETPKTYLVGDATWNTTFGLTLADDTVPAVISYIGYEGENSSIVAEAKAMLEGINQVRINGMNDGTVYNLNGQKVNNPSKGIYIINGKKVVIK